MRNIAPATPNTNQDIDAHIAQRLQALRAQQQLSLAQLAERSGVSKGMISKVERAQSSPTAALLGRLAAGLGMPLAQLLTQEPPSTPQRLRPLAQQPLWTDPQLGYSRRQVRARNPQQAGAELVEVLMPRATQVSYPAWSGKPYSQSLWLLEGTLRVQYGSESHDLSPGDCLDFGVDQPVSFKALGRTGCRYLLVMYTA